MGYEAGSNNNAIMLVIIITRQYVSAKSFYEKILKNMGEIINVRFFR